MKYTEPENKYVTSISPEHRKKFGQIFTPVQIAKFMVKWITDKFDQGQLLDPALGLGIFFRQLPDPQSYQLEGYEIDPKLARMAENLFSSLLLNLTCLKKDFLLTETNKQYDGIICNPPYIHFQDYKENLSLIDKFNQQYNLKLKGFSNIYALFLIKSLQLLKPNGRAAFIIPSEFLNADYGVSIKKFLLKNCSIRHLIIFDPSIQVFEGFLTTSAILLFDNEKKKHLNIFNVKNMADLKQIEKYLYCPHKSSNLDAKTYSLDQLKPEVKWKYYYRDLKINLQLEKCSNLVQFSKFARVKRGIATGANEFFTLSKADAILHRIDPNYLTPCLTRASQIKNNIFDERDLQNLISANKKVFLLTVNSKKIDENLKAYIKWGEKKGFHTRYLTRKRNPWFSMELSTPADLLVKTFSRKQVVFIQNNTRALNLTCFHSIYLNSLGQQYRNIIFLYLITDLAKEIFEGQKREYGSGLGKFEPNDIKQTKVLDFTTISLKDQAILNQLYQQYVKFHKSLKSNAEKILKEAESIFYQYWRK